MAVLFIDEKPHDILSVVETRNGWFDVFVRPQGATVKGPHARHVLGLDFLSSQAPVVKCYTGGHHYELRRST